MERIKSFLINNWIIGALVVMFVISRSVYLLDFFPFGLDEEYQALLGLSLIKNFHILWIGVNAANTGFYLGPAFVYITWVILKIFNLSLMGLAIFPVIVNWIAFVLLMGLVRYITGSQYRAGLVGWLWLVSDFYWFYDRKFWNPTLIPLVTVISLWLVYLVTSCKVKDKTWLVWLIIGVVTGLYFHIHLSLLVLGIMIVVSLIKQIKDLSFEWKKIMMGVLLPWMVGFGMLNWPLIVFDYVHNFSNIKALSRLLFRGSGEVQVKNLSFIANQLADPVWGVVLVLLTGVVIKLLIKNSFGEGKRWFVISVILAVIGFVYAVASYDLKFNDYYLLGFWVLVFLLVGLAPMFDWLIKMIVVILVLTTPFILLRYVQHYDYPGVRDKVKLVKEIKTYQRELKAGNYILKTYPSYRQNPGWQYLFMTYIGQSLKSDADKFFGWIYQSNNQQVSDKVKFKVVIYPESKTGIIKSKYFSADVIKSE